MTGKEVQRDSTSHLWRGGSVVAGAALVALSLGFVLWGYCLACGAIDAGGDEHFELLKGYLTAKLTYVRGVPWNDQPPLYTMLIALVFELTDGSLVAARGLAVVSSVLLCLGAAHRIGTPSDRSWLGVGLCIWLLVSAKSTALLFFTPMLEIPAFGLALLGSSILLRSESVGWAVVGGVVWALAVGVKLTALVMLPAVLAVASVRVWQGEGTSHSRHLVRLTLFLLAFCVSSFAVAVTVGDGAFDALWISHTRASKGGEAEFHRFDPLRYFSTPIGLGLCICLLFGKMLRVFSIGCCFEWVWLLTAVAVHLMHIPCWIYYDLHLNVPAAILVGRAAQTALELMVGGAPRKSAEMSVITWLSAAAISLGAFAATVLPYWQEIEMISGRRRVSTSEMVRAIRRETGPDDFVFCSSGMLNVVSDRLTIPLVAIRPAKRFWSGDSSWSQIWAVVERERPKGFVWHGSSELPENIMTMLANDYRQVCEESGETFWIRIR